MDIFIQNVPQDVKDIELRIFLKDKLHKFDILAFEVKKFPRRDFAILTVANLTSGHSFLQCYGSRGSQSPLETLIYRGESLRFRRSNKMGPEPLTIRALQEKDEAMRTKMAKRAPAAQMTHSSRPTLSFQTLMTGVWDYDQMGKLVFDQKFKDTRQGYITFGKAALVVYLQQGLHADSQWHCRIDIPYAILEHVIPSVSNGSHGTITFTLRSPPKFYHIRSTDDLHLYAGKEAPHSAGLPPDLVSLTLGSNTKIHRLERLCSLKQSNTKNSALCMVYQIAFFDARTAQHAWNFVKDFSVPGVHCWKTMVPTKRTYTIETEFDDIERELSNYDASNDPYYDPFVPSQFDFRVRFQLMALVLEGTITPLKTAQMIADVRAVAEQYGSELTAFGIRQLGRHIPTPGPHIDANHFRVSTLLDLLKQGIHDGQKRELTDQDLRAKRNKHHHLALTYKATVTPTGILLRGPDWTVSNRVLRKYSKHTEYFMRVFFADEDGLSVFHDPRASQEQVYERFRNVLRSGISVAGRTFEFLGFSHSSLRNHQAWFLAAFQKDGVTICARDIIQDLGDFSHIHCSAKCAARIGQAFSDTIFSVPLPSTAFVTETKDDVERNGRCFSDGCGTISMDLIRKIWSALPPERRKQRPTILQIRYRGAKGVLSIDNSLKGEQLHIRKSMTKYIAKEGSRNLELCAAGYKPLPVFLNHQFIKILEDLGVPAENFKSIQDEAVDTLKLITDHPLNAASFLEYSHSAVFAKVSRLFELMHQVGLSFHTDRFLTDIVEVAAMSTLRGLKYRARIPITRGYLLFGIMDETNTLGEGQVYIATRACDIDGEQQRSILVGNRIMVTRAPALHPGDVQLVTAVDVPTDSPLRALYNCIVFSQQGARDLPSQLGGGDLDGDLFHIIYDQRLIPGMVVPPADYEPTPAKDLGRPVQMNDIVNFFVEYMNMDRLGQISNKHKIRADKESPGTLDPDCILLAKLASDAVDFSKSGIPADMSQIPRSNDHIRPDFMAPSSNLTIHELGAVELEELEQEDIDNPDVVSVLDADKFRFRYYRSRNILGVLYRDVDEKKFLDKMKSDFDAFQHTGKGESLVQKLMDYLDRETRGVQWDHHRGFAEELRGCYEDNMLEIMDTLRPHRGIPLTELEVFSGNILGKKERAPSRYIREANIEVRERFDRDVSAVIKRIISGDGDWEGDEDVEVLPRAIACFKIALESKGWENYRNLRSWKYVAAAVCLEQLWKYHGGKLRPLRNDSA